MYLRVVPQHGEGEEGQPAGAGEVVEECQGGGKGVLEVEAGAGVHGRSEVNQYCSDWEVQGATKLNLHCK